MAPRRPGPGDDLPFPETSATPSCCARRASVWRRGPRSTLHPSWASTSTSPRCPRSADAAWPDDLDESGLVVTTGRDERRFRHALTQEAIYSEVPWSRRRALHLALAARVDDPAVAALHLLAGRDFDGARPALLAAAGRHEAAYAYRDAARLLSDALETWPSAAASRNAWPS